MEDGMGANTLPADAMNGQAPALVEDIDLRRSTLQVEQKKIFLNLRENSRGRYLRIAEVTGNNRSTIIIPSSGLMQFRSLLEEFIESDNAVAMGQQAMMPMGDFGVGGVEQSKKKKKNKKKGSVPMENGVNGGEVPAGTEEQVASMKDGSEDKRVFVGNLAWSTTWQTLKDYFAAYGEVTRADVFTERSGRSRGCGLVEFAEIEQAKAAMAALNNTEFEGRLIFVREDREMKEN